MKFGNQKLKNLVFSLAVIPIAFSSNPVSELKTWWNDFDISSNPNQKLEYQNSKTATPQFLNFSLSQFLSAVPSSIAQSINVAADQTALSLSPIKKLVDQLISDTKIKVPTPQATPIPAVISAPSALTPIALLPSPKTETSAPNIVEPTPEKEQPNNNVAIQPSNNSPPPDITYLKYELDYLKSNLSSITSQLRNVPTVIQLPSTNTRGIGDITLNPKTIEPETATISGTTTTGGLVVTGTAQIDGTTKLNGITYTWPSADGSASQFFQTNGSGTLTWVTVRQVTSNSINFDELVDSLTLDANLTIASAGYTFTITDAQVNIGNSRFTSDTNRLGINTTSPSTIFEVQGTASASYFLTGNTIQVGGYASAAYSRFGTNTSSRLSGSNDLLITGILETDGNVFFDSKASISSNLQISGRFIADTAASHSFTGDLRISGSSPTLGINAGNYIDSVFELGGTASISGTTTLRGVTYTWPSADGSSGKFLQTNGTGTLSWATAGVSSNSLDFDEFVSSMTLDANLTINRGASNYFIGLGDAPSTVFEVQGTASASYLLTGNTLQVGGFSSTAYSRFGTGTTGHSLASVDDVLFTGLTEFNDAAYFDSNVFLASASVSGNFEITGNIIPSAQASQSATSQTTTAIDSTGDVGYGTSIAIGTDGFPVIAYFDVTNSDLKVAKCNNAACSSSTLTSIDDVGTITASSSAPAIAIGTDGFPVIAYYFNTTGDFLVTKCGNAACSSGNASTSLDTTNNVGQYPSIAIGRDSMPIISYYDATTNDLKTAYCTNTSCSASTLTSVDTTDDVGKHTSIKISADGLPVVSYYDATNKTLELLHCGKIDCSVGNTIATLDSAGISGRTLGGYTSMAIGESGPIISYYDSGNGDLRIAWCTGAACPSYLGLSQVDATNNVGQYTSIALDAAGGVIISFYDVTNANLRVARCDQYQYVGSCITTTAVKTNIDTTDDVGKYTSIVIGPDGLPFIAYYDVTNANLKTVKCALADCSQTTGGSFNATGSDIGGIGVFFRNVYATQYWGKKFQIANFDVAENYEVVGPVVDAGDIVSVASKGGPAVEKSIYGGKTILGIVSTQPAIVLGEWDEGKEPSRSAPVALQGRVPVKVVSENGMIKVGDRITLSKTMPGYGMKMTEPGQSIGIALETFNPTIDDSQSTIATGKILTFINLSYWAPDVKQLTTDNLQLTTDSNTYNISAIASGLLTWFKDSLHIVFEDGLLKVAKVVVENITATVGTFQKVKTNELCVDDICVTREKFKQVFGESEPVNTPALSESPAPSPEPEPELMTSEDQGTSDVTEPTPEATPELPETISEAQNENTE